MDTTTEDLPTSTKELRHLLDVHDPREGSSSHIVMALATAYLKKDMLDEAMESMLALYLFETNQFEEANGILEKLLEDQIQALGAKDPKTLRTLTHYLRSLLKSRKLEESARVLAECRNLIQAIDDKDSPQAKIEVFHVGEILLKGEWFNDGQDIMHRLLARQRDMFGPEHPETVQLAESVFATMQSIAYGNPIHFDAALVLRSRWSEMKHFLGEDHVDTISALEALADMMWDKEKGEGALPLCRQVFDARRRTLGDGHQYTISSRETLQSLMKKLNHPEASHLPGGRLDGEADNEATPEPKWPRSQGSDDNESQDCQNADQLCDFCTKLDPASYLDAKVDTGEESSYPSNSQTAKALLSRENCSLCRFILTGFSIHKQAPLSRLDADIEISYRYIWSQSLEQDSEMGFSSGRVFGLTADILLLEVSMPQQECLWIYALGTERDHAEGVEAVAEASLALDPTPSDKRQELIKGKDADELGEKLAYLGGKYGYLKGRPASELVDTRLLKAWIHCCDSYHGTECKLMDMKAGSHWRPSWLIDVGKGMLVPGDEGGTTVSYAALSYVWGDESVKQLKHTATDGIADSLKSPGGLTNLLKDHLPDTIRDAMDLCRQIGIPYLWVGAICLDQDNLTNEILNSTGKIYQGACVTIVAAAGEDSWAGLSGIGRSRACHTKESRVTGRVGDMTLGLYLGSRKSMIERTEWNKRAWKFQDMHLSKRLFFFTEKEVFYGCGSGAAWRETVFLEHPQLLSASFSIGAAKEMRLSLAVEGVSQRKMTDIYRGIVKGYMHREMTDSSDVLTALQGILAVVTEKTGEAFHKGVPAGAMLPNLLFNVTGSPHSLRRPNFPSWSWCGWETIRVVDDASAPGLKFSEPPLAGWFEPVCELYRLASPEDSKSADGVYSFSNIDEQAEKSRIQVDAADKAMEWEKKADNMLVFSTDTMQVEVARQGEPVKWDGKLQRYRILTPGLGLRFLDLNKNWRDKQQESLEFVAFARAGAFDETDIISRSSDGFSLVRVGWEDHLVALVAILLVETDATTGISRRLGLYNVEAERWDRAVKSRRMVYLC